MKRQKEAKKSVETLYKGIFSIKESLQDAIQQALEVSNTASEFGGEISRVLTSQINDYFIPNISKYIEDESTPGAIAPLVTFLDSVPLAMTRQEPAAEVIAPSAVNAEETQTVKEVPTLPGAAVSESKRKLSDIGKLLKELDEEVSKESFTNLNIGVPRDQMDTVGAAIEAYLDSKGIYHDNDGGDDLTYNINAGFDSKEEAYSFEKGLKKKYKQIYTDLETFDNFNESEDSAYQKVLRYVGGQDEDEAFELIADALMDNTAFFDGKMKGDEEALFDWLAEIQSNKNYAELDGVIKKFHVELPFLLTEGIEKPLDDEKIEELSEEWGISPEEVKAGLYDTSSEEEE